MPTGYGQQSAPRGYSNYRYNTPSTQQYESFFNPIPLEFMAEQLGQSQEKYDTAYAGALQAKDQYGGVQVGMPDIADKNRIINDFTNNVDKTVQEQFGGDWGRASKTIAKMVTDIRQDPFWNTTKELDKRREEERALVAQYGPNALKFNSIQNLSAIDPKTGKVRTPDQMNYDILEKGNWNKTVQDIIGKVSPDTNPYGLTKEDFGYISRGEITEVTQKKLEALANDPNIQQAVISQHPEMVRAFNELPDQKTALFGQDKADIKDAVKGLILGNISSQAFKQYQKKDMQNIQLQEENARAAAAAKNKQKVILGAPREMVAQQTGYGTSNRDQKLNKAYLFGNDGKLFDSNATFGLSTPTGTRLGETSSVGGPTRTANQIKADNEQMKKELEANPVWKARKRTRDLINETVVDLRKNNPTLTSGKTDKEIYEDYLTDEKKYKQSIDISIPIIDESVNTNIGKAIASNVSGTEFTLTDGSNSTLQWMGENGIEEQTGLPYQGFVQSLTKGEIFLGYNKMKGSVYAEVPKITKLKLNSDGTVNWNETQTDGTKVVYFAPDQDMKLNSQVVQFADKLLKDPNADIQIPEGIKFNKDKLDKRKDVNFQDVFSMPMQPIVEQDANGNFIYYDPKGYPNVKKAVDPTEYSRNPSMGDYSLEDIREIIYQENLQLLGSNYYSEK